jgi:hypothetical protein
MPARLGSCCLLLLLAGCAGDGSSKRCAPPFRPAPVVDLFFGRSVPGGGEVSEAEWRRFVDEDVTPRFPDGLTIFDAQGQWRSAGVVERENSKVVRLLAIEIADLDARLAAVMAAYLMRFHQRSVLRYDSMGCYYFGGAAG